MRILSNVLVGIGCLGGLVCGACSGSSTTIDGPESVRVLIDAGIDATGDAEAPRDAGMDAVADARVDPPQDAGSDSDTLADGQAVDAGSPALCCTNADYSAQPNVHCGPGAWAPCTFDGGTYNAADCSGGLGGSCQAWPDSYDYCLPQDCCKGIVAVCGASM